MGFEQIADKVSTELMELAGQAGLIMVGVAALVWIVGQKKSAKDRVIAIIQGLSLAVLGPIVYKWFFAGLKGVKGSIAVGSAIGLF